MNRSRARFFAIVVLLSLLPVVSYGQRKSKKLVCKDETFAAIKPLPELTYECPPDIASESDDRILKSPERAKAVEKVTRRLRSFTYADWWNSSVDDLNACYVRGEPGPLNAEQREEFTSVEYQPRLLGNNRVRLVLTPDPCYQTYFNGSNAFLLHREGAKVYVTQALDGYFSRLAKSVFLKFSKVNSEEVIEIETVNISGMRPEPTSYYFVIDKATNKAIPKKLFTRGRRRTRNV